MAKRVPEGPPPPPPVQRIRLQYAKRGRMRLSSHRDFARAFERALRRAEVPMAYSAGFHPHPKISYVGAAPTGVGSEAEYLEIALRQRTDPESVRAAIDRVLPEGLDMVAAVDAVECPPGGLVERMEVSLWQLEFADEAPALRAAMDQLLATDSVVVERLTKDGRRSIDARAPLVSACVDPVPRTASVMAAGGGGMASSATPAAAVRAILELVVRQVTPTVRPDDVLTALHSVAGFAPMRAPRATRLAQGPLLESGLVGSAFGDNKFAGKPVGGQQD